MWKNCKKAMAGTLGMCMLVTSIPGVSELEKFAQTNKVAYAATTENVFSGECGENATWEYNSETKTLSISGSGKMKDYEEGYLTPWNMYRDEVEKIVIGDGITAIGDFSFQFFLKLNDIQFGADVETVGSYSFSNCASLKKIRLGGNIKVIQNFAFDDCNNLEDVYIGKNVENVGYDRFAQCERVEIDPENKYFAVKENKVVYTDEVIEKKISCGENAEWQYDEATKTLTVSGSGIMKDNSNEGEVDIEEHISYFPYAEELETVIIGDGITEIGESCFLRCTALKKSGIGKRCRRNIKFCVLGMYFS